MLIYFEHRNYLPAIGLLLALASLLVAAASGLRSQLSERAPMLAKMALLALIAVLAARLSPAPASGKARSCWYNSHWKIIRHRALSAWKRPTWT